MISGFRLDEAEVIYLLSNPADFGNISLNALPTQASDHTVAGAQALFGQFLRLAYTTPALRNGPAGGTDGLVAVFSNARQVIPLAPLPPGLTALQVTSQNFLPGDRQRDAPRHPDDPVRHRPALGPGSHPDGRPRRLPHPVSIHGGGSW